MRGSIYLFSVLMLLISAGAQAEKSDEPLRQVTQHTVFEVSFQSDRDYSDPLRDISLKVVVKSPSGDERSVDAFWDGGKVWRVRFSPDQPGEWKWHSECSDKKNSGLHGKSGIFRCSVYNGTNPLYRHGPIRLSANRRYLEHSDGEPFFWLADTAWNGLMKSRRGDWDRYLVERRKQGFSVVQFVSTHWRAFETDMHGDSSYSGSKRISVNPDFYKRLDPKVSAINRAGLVAAPVILWAYGKDDPGKLPEDQAILLARYITARWGAYQVVWILAGDGDYRRSKAERWKRIGRAVFPEDRNRLVTMHSGGQQWVGDEFRKERWYDFIGYQSGHGDSADNLKWLTSGPPAKNYTKEPYCPIINLEPNYEAHNAYQSKKPFDAHKVRRALYWSLLISPTAGVSYGHHGVWPWNTKRETPRNHPRSGEAPPWHEAIHSEGAASVKHLRELFDSLPWWQLQPCPEAVITSTNAPEKFIAAAKTDDNRLLLAYLPEGVTMNIKPGTITLPATAQWFDPRTGEWRSAGEVEAKFKFTAPDGRDWVLYVQSNQNE